MTQTRLRRTASAGAAFTLFMMGAAAFAAPAQAADGDVAIDFAVISDFHGHIENAAALDYQIKKMKGANPQTRFISVGDNVGGSAYVSAVDNDNPTMDILKAMGLELTASGNHEMDKGYSDLTSRIQPRLGIPVLLANATGTDAQATPPYVIEDYDGKRVAFVGALTSEIKTLVAPSAIAGLTFSDPVATVDKIAAQLKDGDPSNGEADAVVALVHADLSTVNKLGSNVDLAFGGHTHTPQTGHTASGAPTCEPVNYGTAFVQANLTFAADGNVTASCNLSDKVDPANGETPEIKAMYDAAVANAQTLGGDPVGYIDRQASRGALDGQAPGSNRGTESAAGNLIAEGFYQYGQTFANKADLGIMNPGGVRADFDYAAGTVYPKDVDGLVTKGESNTVQPFGNVFGTEDYTGAQLYTMLEQQWGDPAASHPMLRLGLSSNVQYVYNPNAEAGKHVTALYIDGKLVPNDDSATYTVASNNFLVGQGGDGFKALAEGKNYVDTGILDNDAFNAYLQNFTAAEPLHVDYTQRSVGVASYPTKVTAGDTVTFKLSSLMMTAGEPAPKTATITLTNGDKTVSAEATVNPVIDAKGYDESGLATVTLTVPADFPAGAAELTITTDDGTTSPAPSITVLAASTAKNPTDGATPGGTGAVDNGATDNASPSGQHKAPAPEQALAASSNAPTTHGLARTGASVYGLTLASLLMLLGGTGVAAAARRERR
ncbi:MAG: 5'-nucleotidase C-terminal domain-containing protein [Actinomycetaceae bacterium]|nr:5'-nucleotidase C-terminal domain-containing protein [Actinomycetaceae bacterium]MDY6083362.1 5'-nucleotidase C-terminal domain-containing protein [Actinomycetaceae bacterium]